MIGTLIVAACISLSIGVGLALTKGLLGLALRVVVPRELPRDSAEVA